MNIEDTGRRDKYLRESYGIICIDLYRRCTLMVHRKSSPFFLHFLRGFFDRSTVREMIHGCSTRERDFIRGYMLLDGIEVRCNSLRSEYMKYGRRKFYRFDESVETIEKCRKKITVHLERMMKIDQRDPIDTEWTWPKGGKNKYDVGTIDCAMREFKEETGYTISQEPLSEKLFEIYIPTIFGKVLKIGYHLAVIDSHGDKIKLTGEYDTTEVKDVQWIPFSDLIHHVSDLRYLHLFQKILDTLVDFLDQKRLTWI